MKTEELKFEPILYLEQSFSESAHSLQMHLKIWIWQYWFTIFVTLTHTWKILHDAGQWGKGGTLLASKPSGGKVVNWLLCKMKIRKTKQAICGWGSQEPVLLLGKGIPDSLRRWTLHSWHACTPYCKNCQVACTTIIQVVKQCDWVSFKAAGYSHLFWPT